MDRLSDEELFQRHSMQIHCDKIEVTAQRRMSKMNLIDPKTTRIGTSEFSNVSNRKVRENSC